MKKTFTLIVLSLIIIITGCSPAPTPEPTPTEVETPVMLPDLNNTSWLLSSLNGNDPISNTYVILMFFEGWATGNAGCNDYGGEYSSATDGYLEVHFMIRHRASCQDPPGIMEQEELYLNILENVSQYGIVEGKLRLYSGDGDFLDFGYFQAFY